ncbi:MAG: hypothetical protein ACP5TL_03235 [Candidatus Micrarchaeia archaeon]
MQTEITNLNLKWRGEIHQAPGLKSNKRIIDLVIPFHNREDSIDMLKNILKSQVLNEVGIKDVRVSAPFKLLSVEPTPPCIVEYGSKIDFKLKIEVPDYDYKGPIDISFLEDEHEKVKIEINKITLLRGTRSVDIPSTEMILELRKGQAFKVNVQLYKILSYMDMVKGIKVNKPFSFISSMPSTPFSINNKNSFLATIFVQAPDLNYGGPLEISLL